MAKVDKQAKHLLGIFLPDHIQGLPKKKSARADETHTVRESIRSIQLTPKSLTRGSSHFRTLHWLWKFVIDNELSARRYCDKHSWATPATPLAEDSAVRVVSLNVLPSKLRLYSLLNKTLEYDSKYNGPAKAVFSLDGACVRACVREGESEGGSE